MSKQFEIIKFDISHAAAAAEVEKAKQSGFAVATLGPRILRAVTAPLAALGAVMLLSGNMD